MRKLLTYIFFLFFDSHLSELFAVMSRTELNSSTSYYSTYYRHKNQAYNNFVTTYEFFH